MIYRSAKPGSFDITLWSNQNSLLIDLTDSGFGAGRGATNFWLEAEGGFSAFLTVGVFFSEKFQLRVIEEDCVVFF
jgi:hypothetical protein